MRQADVDFVVAAARFAADQLLAEAADPGADLSQAERRSLVTIAVAVDRVVAQRAGLPARSAEAQAIIDRALTAVLPGRE